MKQKQTYIYHKVINAKKIIDAQFREQMNLDKMINLSNMSSYHFIKIFKAIYGVPPNQYLSQMRVIYAKQDLTTTDRPISDICENLGFQSLCTFSSIFRRFTGQYPTQYRELSQSIKLKSKNVIALPNTFFYSASVGNT